MKKILTIFALALTLCFSLSVAAFAQERLYIYRHGGSADTLSMSVVSGISHSRTDLAGHRHADYVVMTVRLADSSQRQYLLSALDSVVIDGASGRIHLTRLTGRAASDGSRRSRGLRRTSLDGDFESAAAGVVEFFWTADDYIYILDDGSLRSDSVDFLDPQGARADFFFKSGNITGDEVQVYYPGQAPLAYNEVRVASAQSQAAPGSSAHIGVAGDCGTAVATKKTAGEGYEFELEHKASYLCFLPYIANSLGRTELLSVTVRSDSAIAGVFTLDPSKGMVPKSDTTHTVTLTTRDFTLPQSATQNASAYMVVAPQPGAARLTCEFTVYDRLLGSTGVYSKTVDLAAIEPNMVYVVKANCNNYVVDLGLPVKFLNHNMGAFAPEEHGGYYAYGELEDKGVYNNNSSYVHYSTPAADIQNIRLTDYDVAHVRLGGNFSMPTSDELSLLKDSCKWVWQASFNGKAGYIITGKNGNTLFLPAAGYRTTGANDLSTRGIYRTSMLVSPAVKKGWVLSFTSTAREMNGNTDAYSAPYNGMSIRPVVSTGVQMTDGTLVQVMTDSVQWRVDETSANLFGSVYGLTSAKSPVEVGFVVGKSSVLTIENGTTLTATAAGDGIFSASFALPKDTVYYYRAYVRASGDSISYANTLQFGRSYVDLGLPSGTKWANISLGAAAPYQDGDYYAWGETTTKSTYPNDASNYRWYTHKTWIEPDRLLDIQATDVDAASANWGGVWMMPDSKDLKELTDNCDFIASTMNGVKGYTIKSRINGNTIFMPLSGYFRTAHTNYANNGYIATSSLPGTDNRADRADLLDNTSRGNWHRSDGMRIRPVYKTNATSADDKPMFIRTLVAAKQFDGTTETDTLKATVQGLAGTTGVTVGFSYSNDKAFATDTKVTISKSDNGMYSYVFSPAEPGTRTYYRAFVCSGGNYYYGDTLKVDAVGVVDLGLSVLWANVDLGAASADEHGDFYRWGATKPFRGDNSNYYSGNKNITPLSGHDTATELWGSSFRMPTLEEFRELINNCTVTTETSDNGVQGRRFTSKVEGYTDRSIFLPNSGVFTYNDSYRYSVGSENSHWTSTNSDGSNAYRVMLGNDNGAASQKGYGFPVRPVQEKLARIYNSGFARGMVGGVETDTLKGYTVNTSGTAQTFGFLLGESRVLNKDSKLSQYDVTTANGDFLQTVSGLTPGKRYYYRAFATDGDEWKYAPVDSFDVAGEVDLGLSVKWANVNIGAQHDASYGEYYQWGALEPFVSNTTHYYLESKDITPQSGSDTAYELWGGAWRMPTKEEWQELIDNCTWTWTNANGYYGMRVTSKKAGYTDRSIFLPSAGYYQPGGTYGHDYNNTSGDYWTSSFKSGNDAYYHSFWNTSKSNETDPKGYGFSVRAVADYDVAAAVSAVDVTRSTTDFTQISIECYAKATPANATVGVLYGTSRSNLLSDAFFATIGHQGSFTVTLSGLTPGASYYYVPYIRQGSTYVAKGDTLKFTTYELVDLDLPSGLLWMNLDLGADSLCGNGDYYQWGAVVPYPQTGWTLHESVTQNLTESGHDAVRNTLGGLYRMPTYTETVELVNNATWLWTTMNGVPGYKVSSKTNSDRFIFLPTTGYLNNSGALQYENTRGNYWTSTWYNSTSARDLGGGNATAHTGDDGNSYDPSYYGSFLRPVLSVIKTNKPQTTDEVTYQLHGSVNSVWGYGGDVRVGFVYSMSQSPTVDAVGSIDAPVSVTQTGDYSYVLTNLGNNTTYYYRAYIYDGTTYHYGAEQVFTTMEASSYQAVDLGLPSGTKWSNMNVGADSETGVGKFFAWGETYSKTGFSTGTYDYYDYNYYKVIGEDIAGTKYDAARAIMGGLWSMPTKAQFDELCDPQYTKWTWGTENGRSGYRVTSLVEGYTDRSIFLPASGWMDGTTLKNDNSRGYFWLSSFYNSDEAYYSYFYNGTKGANPDPRWEGFPIRGVINNGLTTNTGTVAAATAGVDWTIGASTATLRGRYATLGTVAGVTYGFVVGNSTDLDAATADASNVLTASGASADGSYSLSYSYDGGVRYFRAFAKVGSSYAYGEVKSVGPALLLDLAFAADGTATNYAFTGQRCVKYGSPAITYNADYKRYEADLSANAYNGTAGHYYSVRFLYDNDFISRLVDGHTLEALVRVPYLTSTAESDILANYENGGTGIGIHNKTFFTQAYIAGVYRSVYDGDDLDDQDGTYHHVVGVYDKEAQQLRLYVDGQPAGTQTARGAHTVTSTSAARYYMVGGNPDDRTRCVAAWNGSVVFARIYDDALTDAQVKTLYDNLKK